MTAGYRANGRTVAMKKLIELDAAIKATWKDTGYTDPLNVMTAIRDRIEALPTVDAVPVIHGRWTIEDRHASTYPYCCSNCTAHHRARYDYFPSCGAKMDGKDGDEHG